MSPACWNHSDGGQRHESKLLLTHLRTPWTSKMIPKSLLQHWFKIFSVNTTVCSVCLSAGDMAMNNYVGDSAQKWPQIFISTSGKRVCGPPAPAVPYPTVLPAFTVQLEAVLRTSLSVGQQTGQDQEPLPQTHIGNRLHRSPWLWTAGWPKGRDLGAGAAWLLMPSR